MRRYCKLLLLPILTVLFFGCHSTDRGPEINTQYLPLLEKSDRQSTPTEIESASAPLAIPTIESSPAPSILTPDSIQRTSIVLLPLVMRPKLTLELSWRLFPKTKQQKLREGTYTYQIVFPLIEGQTKDPVAGFQLRVMEIVAQEKADFLSALGKIPVENPGGFWIGNYQVTSTQNWRPSITPADYSSVPTELKAKKAVVNYGHTVLGILFQIQTFIGGSQAVEHHRVINYDLDTGQVLELSDLFKPEFNHLKVISDIAIPELLNRAELDGTMVLLGASPQAENYHAWNITSQGLIITFEENQVGAAPAGAQQILIPYDLLSFMLDPEGPLGALTR